MFEERRLTIAGVLDQVPIACDFVAEAAESIGLDERGVYHCQMAIDEWCTNIIEHGLRGNGAESKIHIALKLRPPALTMVIQDDGPPFDPTTLPEPDPKSPLEERRPGGLGWFFIRKIMDSVHYEYQSGKNTLTIVKKGARLTTRPEPQSPFPAHTRDGVRVIAPDGRLDSTLARQLETALLAQMEGGFFRLVIDMGNVVYIASTGLKALLTARRRLETEGGKMALAAFSDRVREIFELSGFDRLFIITRTVGEAVSAVADQ